MNATSNERPTAVAMPFVPPGAEPSPPPPRATAGPGAVSAWLDGCEDELLHPARVQDRLFRAGWGPDSARSVAAAYRARFNQHALGYAALLITTGLAALGAGTSGHLLAAGIHEPVDRDSLGLWLTLMMCALPFAVWAHVWAARTDRVDPVAVWSVPRRSLATVLLWACGIVGVGRLLIYSAQLIGVIVGASWAEGVSLLAGAVNVGITVSIALPLGLWAYRFLHRFDQEDPTAPAVRARPTASAGTSSSG
jgi:hypothetical protein